MQKGTTSPEKIDRPKKIEPSPSGDPCIKIPKSFIKVVKDTEEFKSLTVGIMTCHRNMNCMGHCQQIRHNKCAIHSIRQTVRLVNEYNVLIKNTDEQDEKTFFRQLRTMAITDLIQFLVTTVSGKIDNTSTVETQTGINAADALTQTEIDQNTITVETQTENRVRLASRFTQTKLENPSSLTMQEEIINNQKDSVNTSNQVNNKQPTSIIPKTEQQTPSILTTEQLMQPKKKQELASILPATVRIQSKRLNKTVKLNTAEMLVGAELPKNYRPPNTITIQQILEHNDNDTFIEITSPEELQWVTVVTRQLVIEGLHNKPSYQIVDKWRKAYRIYLDKRIEQLKNVKTTNKWH